MNKCARIKGTKIALILLILMLPLMAGIVSAELKLPPAIQEIQKYNQQYAFEFMQTISIPLVFLAGVLSIVSPCILPLIPAFFSYTFKEKKKISLMSLIFFAGFSIVFVAMGIAAAYVGQSITVLQAKMSYLVYAAGLFLIFFGTLAFIGRGFSSIIKVKKKAGNDIPGVFLMGITFAIGWTACLGPIIAGILLMVAAFGNVSYAAFLLFIYSLGILAPLLVLSVFYDKFNLGSKSWIKGREVSFAVGGKTITTHTTSMISGILLIGIGLLFIIFGGTDIVNSTSIIGSSILFSNLQRMLLENPALATVLGTLTLLAVVIPVAAFAIKSLKNREN